MKKVFLNITVGLIICFVLFIGDKISSADPNEPGPEAWYGSIVITTITTDANVPGPEFCPWQNANICLSDDSGGTDEDKPE